MVKSGCRKLFSCEGRKSSMEVRFHVLGKRAMPNIELVIAFFYMDKLVYNFT